MDTKEKAAQDGGILTALDTALHRDDSTANDPVKGWYSLAQPAKDRQQKAPLKKAKIGEGAKR